jgi:hypothetical protein
MDHSVEAFWQRSGLQVLVKVIFIIPLQVDACCLWKSRYVLEIVHE